MKKGFLFVLLVVLALLFALYFFRQSQPVEYHPKLGWAASSTTAVDLMPDANDPEAWSLFNAANASVSFEGVDGQFGPAVRINYSLSTNDGRWCGGYLPLNMDRPEAGRIGFWIRGEGLRNNFELKIKDTDGGVFMRGFINEASSSDWHWVEADLREFRYGWNGTDKKLDAFEGIEMTIAIGHGLVAGGDGWVEVEGLSFVGANPRLEVDVSQVGFDRKAPKRAVLRLVNAPADWDTLEPPCVKIGPTMLNLTLHRPSVTAYGKHAWGGQYWVADFSSFRFPGSYEMRVELDTPDGPLQVSSYPFEICDGIVAERTGMSQFNYIYATRYPTDHPHEDPVPGGYIDTEFDIEKWMTTTPTWVWGMARFMRAFPDAPGDVPYDPQDELTYAVDFMLAMQDPADGGVYVGVNALYIPPGGTNSTVWPGDMTVETDPTPRTLTKYHGLDINTAYAVAMAECSMALRNLDPERSVACLEAAELAWQWCGTQNPALTQDVGMWLWASTRLHEVTGEKVYLDKARELAAQILPRQFTDASKGEDGVCGRFFRTDAKQDFDYQYKYVHAVGIELGLLDLAEALPESDPLRIQILDAMELYVRSFLQKTAAANPYGVVAQALHWNEGTGLWTPYYFAIGRHYATHGLNCDIMSSGLVALRFARLTGQSEFEDLAWEQLQWVLGKNPFGFCMITGIGTTNPYTMTDPWPEKGPTLGGLINGIVGDEGTSAPSFDIGWGSSEYWKPHNAMFLALVSELEE